MKLKSKLIFTCIAFVVTLSFLMMGVFAMKNVNFDMGGSIGFSASGITATISQGTLSSTGLYKNAEDEGTKMKEVKIDTSMTNSDLKNLAEYKSWQNLQFLFNDKGEDVTVKFTVTNTSTKGDNFTIDVTYGAEQSKNASIDVSPTYAMLTPGDAQEFTVTFAVTEKGTDASLSGFNIGLNMQYFEAKDASTYSTLYFDYVENHDAYMEGFGMASASAVSEATTSSNMRELFVHANTENMPNVDTLTIPGYVTYNNEICKVTMLGAGLLINLETLTTETISEDATEYEVITIYNKHACKVKKVILPGTITEIHMSAFMGSLIESFPEGDNIKIIHESAFMACTALKSIDIPSSVTYISDGAFGHCTDAVSVTIPNSVTYISDGAFYSCLKIMEVTNKSTLDVSAESLGIGLGVIGSLETVVKTDDSTNIFKDENDFVYYYNQADSTYWLIAYHGTSTDLVFPESVNGQNYYLRAGAFSFDFYENVTFSTGILGGNAPFAWSGIKSLTIPSWFPPESYTEYMFFYMTDLETLIFEEGTTVIDIGLIGCSRLNKVVIPKSVYSVASGVFNIGATITDIYYTGNETEWSNISFGSSNSDISNATIHCGYVMGSEFN